MTIKELALNGTLAHNAQDSEPVGHIGGYVLQPKLDGWRLLAEVAEGHVNLYSRTGINYRGQLPAVEAHLLARFQPGTWLDGEATSIEPVPGEAEEGIAKVINRWHHAQSALTKGGPNIAADKITYMVFDLIASAGIDARSLPYRSRRALLEKVFDGWPESRPVQLVAEYPADDQHHDALVAAGYEGSILRRLVSPYASGKRGHGLHKRKATATEDVIVMAFEAGKDVGAVVFGQFKNGKLVKRGKAKRKPDLIPTPDLMAWAGKVIEVEHNGVFPGGSLRHPRMLRIRDDKPAADCVWA